MRVKDDLLNLLSKYSFSKIDDKYPRSKKVPCPERFDRDHSKMIQRGECICDGGVYYVRIQWVNSEAAWIARVGDDTVLLMYFIDFCDWFSVCVYKGLKGTLPVDKKNLRTPHTNLEANTTNWSGQEEGSGIRRFPESIRGFMYRGPIGNYGDAHFLPKTDIVSHLTNLK